MMPDRRDPSAPPPRDEASGRSPWRFVPLAVVVALSILIVAMGWHRHLSFEAFVHRHAVLRDFIAYDLTAAVAAYVALYVVVVALSVPGALFLTVAGGIMFGALLGGVAALVGATVGAVCIFLIAKSALGEHLVRRAGPRVAKIAEGFRADAFSYLLFLRLVPIFPFWLVNLVPALAGVRFVPFVAATALGIVPATFAFASVGAGLDSIIAAQEAAYRACLATGAASCRLDFDLTTAVTPQLLAALVALGVVALIPVAVKKLRARRMAGSSG
jgi:uncharacterized membrane protein YdjX (TVP38/TMEM64 family)